MSLKSINVKYPPRSTSPDTLLSTSPGTPRSTSPDTLRSTEEAEMYRNERVDKLLSEALESGRSTNADVDEYYELFGKLQISSDPAEREQILERMAESVE